jgi:PAS domain S-box-containing protein
MLGINTSLDQGILGDERLKGAAVTVRLRWIFILIVGMLLAFQGLMGYKEVSEQALLFFFGYLIANMLQWLALRRQYDPPWVRYVAALLDISFVSYHIFGMAAGFDPFAATASATMFFYPLFFLLYTFRLDRNLLIFLIIIALIGFNIPYAYVYLQSPEVLNGSLSLTPMAHMFKTVYIAFTGLLCIYLQYSMFLFLQKQLAAASEKGKLNVAVKVEQERNRMNEELIARERNLNRELEEQIRQKDSYAKELNETQGLINTLMSNLVGAVSRCLFDDDFTASFYSEKIYDITGYKSEEFINNNKISFGQIILPEDIQAVRDQIGEAVSTGRPYSLEFRIRHRDGRVVWVHENGQPVLDASGDVLYLDGITTDVTGRKYAEVSYREFTEFLPQTVYETDAKGYLVFSNRAARDMFGEGFPDETGRIHTSQFFPIDQRDRMMENIANPPQVKEGERYMFETRAVKKDGSLCDVVIFSAPILRDGKVVGERGIIADISDIKKTEAELKKAKEELERVNSDLEQTIQERTAQLTEANTQLLRVQKENLQSQFEVLKQQVNPHFLFNSLNVLTSLIKVDPDLAETFTERLSKVYRYVLENKDKDLVSLATEMEFLRAYVFLIDIRFTGKVFVTISFDEHQTDAFVVPLALQLLIENAIKHNTFSKKSPLKVELFIDEEQTLNVVNNLQNRETHMKSTGIGLVNITKRYALLSDRQPSFEMTNDRFIARIPLIFMLK